MELLFGPKLFYVRGSLAVIFVTLGSIFVTLGSILVTLGATMVIFGVLMLTLEHFRVRLARLLRSWGGLGVTLGALWWFLLDIWQPVKCIENLRFCWFLKGWRVSRGT